MSRRLLPERRERRDYEKARYHQRKARGVCPSCATLTERFVYCQACREHRAAWVAARKEVQP